MEVTHHSVLLAEAVDSLAPVAGGIYVDGNLGLGGHTAAILERSAPNGRVIGFDWDALALEGARQRLAAYGDRVHYVRRNFATLRQTLAELGITEIDGLLLDLGLSSLQLDGGERGFSFRYCEPLDMRMDDRLSTSAADLINTLPQEDLADIFYHYGEERQARRIARWLVDARKKMKITSTDQLAALVEQAIPRPFHPRKIHVATKVFQALRIAVNRELDNLVTVLADGVDVLKPGGRFSVISFHSLEDRLVKCAFRDNPRLRVLTRKPVTPGVEECDRNPRARSAKMRVAQREDRA